VEGDTFDADTLRKDLPRGRRRSERVARVLVIDDEPDVRWLLRLSLERVGHEVLLAEDGLRGVAMAQRQRPDAIVLDLMMPVMDGYGVLEALGKDRRTSRVPVMVLTAKAIPDEGDKVTAAGALRFLTKPFDPDDLAVELERLLAEASGSPDPA
jgi:CheY-like chemotaxis protein